MLVFENFFKMLMVSDKTIYKAFRIYKTLQTNYPLEIFFLTTVEIRYKEVGYNKTLL